jgi:hypothetical protein
MDMSMLDFSELLRGHFLKNTLKLRVTKLFYAASQGVRIIAPIVLLLKLVLKLCLLKLVYHHNHRPFDEFVYPPLDIA